MKVKLALLLAALSVAPVAVETARAEPGFRFFVPGVVQFHLEERPRARARGRGELYLEGRDFRDRAYMVPLTPREVTRLLRMNGYSDVEIVSRRHLSFRIAAVDERERDVVLTVSRRDGAILSERIVGAPRIAAPEIATPGRKRLPKVVAVPPREKRATAALPAPETRRKPRRAQPKPEIATVAPAAPVEAAPPPRVVTPRVVIPARPVPAPATTAAIPPKPTPVPAPVTPTVAPVKPTPAPATTAAIPPKPTVVPPKPAPAPATAAIAPKVEPAPAPAATIAPVPPKPVAAPAPKLAPAATASTTPPPKAAGVRTVTPETAKDKPPVLLKKPGEKAKDDDLVVY